jgi:hypothetical protein
MIRKKVFKGRYRTSLRARGLLKRHPNPPGRSKTKRGFPLPPLKASPVPSLTAVGKKRSGFEV